MKNVNKNIFKYFEKLVQKIINTEPNLEKMRIVGEKLSKKLNKNFISFSKKNVIVVKRWSVLWNKLRQELLFGETPRLFSQLESELLEEVSSLRFKLLYALNLELKGDLFVELRNLTSFTENLNLELRVNSGLESYFFFSFHEMLMLVYAEKLYPQLNVIKKNKNVINCFKDLLKAGTGYLMMSKRNIYLLPFPRIKLLNNRLHSETEPACIFLGKPSYWLYGYKLNKKLWKRIVRKKMTFKQIMEFKNIKHRMIALKMIGIEKILKEAKAKLIDKSGRGNELYLIEGVFSCPAYFLKYQCPSTGRVYIKGIPPNFAQKPEELTADNAQAFTFKLSLDEYYKLIES